MTRRFVLLAPASLFAADRVAWRKAVVLSAGYMSDPGFTGTAPASTGARGGGLGPTVFRGEFEFDDGAIVYTATESVAGNARLPVATGDSVLIAVEKKQLRVKLPNGKTRSLNLAATLVKSKSP